MWHHADWLLHNVLTVLLLLLLLLVEAEPTVELQLLTMSNMAAGHVMNQ
jgi:hypothetical protein